MSNPTKVASEKWLHGLADKLKLPYRDLMDACQARYKEPGQGNGWFPSSEIQTAMDFVEAPSEADIEMMWKHWEVVTGTPARSTVDSPFECSC